ncbi:CLUMA_CG007228, isoform A [Clunio marinus]|uniref:CLUMA_CG007228, isoform A n=1 Tax=Clunio marinus TaxID=568069 RepID=A0A1J1I285_9DIPT|nr:CLUMA_CG007228, isoform A [Clunio marinus]
MNCESYEALQWKKDFQLFKGEICAVPTSRVLFEVEAHSTMTNSKSLYKVKLQDIINLTDINA